MERACNGCTACCKTHGVIEINKMAGKWCPHCYINKGCGIYSTRPKSCENFKCAWLLGIGNLEHRPDKTNIVPDYRVIPGIGMTMWFFEFLEGALQSDFARRWTLRNLLVGNCVMHVPLIENTKLYLPQKIDGSKFSFVFGVKLEKTEIIQFPESISRLK